MWWRRRDADDFADEVASHLEHEEARLRATGMSPDAARREARRAFGNPTRSVERVRDAARWRLAGTLWQDARYAARLMRRGPGFTATATLVLSLGIGVNTALFSIVNALFFTPLPVERPEELVYFYSVNEWGVPRNFMSPDQVSFFREQGQDILEFSSHWPVGWRLSADDETSVVYGEFVDPNYFDILGVRTALGRTLGPAEDDPSNPELAAVISHDLWTRRFRAAPDILGKEIRLDQKFFRIVGVAEPGFEGLTDPLNPRHFWVTGTQYTGRSRQPADGPFARMKPEVTFEDVKAFVAAKTPLLREILLARAMDRPGDYYERYRQQIRASSFRVEHATDVVDPRDPDSTLIPPAMLAALSSVVGLVLLIASANIAGLLLARGVTRTGEVAVRRAMGAGGARLARQLVTESVLLTTLGGALGLAVAWNLVELFTRLTPSRFAFDVALDWRVLAFAALVCVVTGVLVGLAPALQALRVNVLEALGSGIVGSRTARGSIRRWVVIPQIGLSLVLLLVAGVHVRALMGIELTDRGYQTSDGFVVSIGRWEPRIDVFARAQMTPEERRQQQEDGARKVRDFNRNVLQRVADLPGVSSVAIAASLPHSSYAPSLRPLATQLPLSGATPAEAGAIRSVVSDAYFDVMDMTLVRGRPFDSRDSLYRPKVAIVSESLERELGRGVPLIGRHVGFQDAQDGNVEWLEVIGVVGDVRPVLDDRPPLPVVYVSLMQQWQGTARNLIVRGYGGDATALADPVKRAVIGADAFAEAYEARTMEQVVGEILYPRRLAAGILATAGLIGMALASIGLYGVVSFSVARRRREIGIRSTLGAGRRDILALILREGAVVAGVGCGAGLALGVLALRLTAGLIPDLPTVDVLAFVAVPAALVLVVLAACYVPARRAARVDPAEVLRSL